MTHNLFLAAGLVNEKTDHRELLENLERYGRTFSLKSLLNVTYELTDAAE